MKIKETLDNYKRVLKITHKPSREDFVSAVRICTIGMLVMGMIGFLVYLIAVFTGL
jgi:protein transport protein SEC61 subunit gamma-like protein